jgi:hypothetical protein
MKAAIFCFISISLISVVLLSGCRSTGSEFVGKWVNIQNPNDCFQVSRNGDEFLIVTRDSKVGAVYKDGTLEVKGAILSASLTYVKQTDTVLGPGFYGEIEYRRQK